MAIMFVFFKIKEEVSIKFRVCLIITLFTSLHLFAQKFDFKNLTRERGLSNNFVTSIYQDDYGFMWFGTRDGLNQYDGKIVKNYYRIEGNANSLNSSIIRDMLFTSMGEMLIANSGGVNKFNYTTESFSQIEPFNATKVKLLVEDSSGFIWGANTNNVLVKLDSSLSRVSNFSFVDLLKGELKVAPSAISIHKFDEDNLMIFVRNQGFYLFNLITQTFELITGNVSPDIFNISRILRINDSEFWVGTLGGIFVYRNKKLIKHLKQGNGVEDLNNKFVQSLIRKSKDEIWVLTDGGGVNVYNLRTNQFSHINRNVRNDYSISSNFLFSSYMAKDSTLWVGSIKNGVSQLVKNIPFTTYKLRDLKRGVRTDHPVSSLYLDSRNRIWIGSDGNGLYKLEDDVVEHVYRTDRIKTIPSIGEFSSNKLILGTYLNGIYSFDIKNSKETQEKILNDSMYRNAKIHTIGRGNNENLIIGGNKLIVVHPMENSKGLLKPMQNSLDYSVRTINNEEGHTLIGTFGSLFEFTNEEMQLILEFPGGIRSLIKFGESTYWGGSDKGLCLVDVESKEVLFYGKNHGLNTNRVNSVVKGESNELWLGTSLGVSKFDIKTKKFTNFTYRDEFRDNEFKDNAVVKTSDGTLYFGGLKGVLKFHPKDIQPSKEEEEKVVFTKIRINHEEVDTKEVSPLDKYIALLDEVRLTYNQKVITIDYSTFEFEYPEKIQFRYKLEDFDEDWKTTYERNLTYMNLDPGEYFLNVKASNTLGEFGETVAIMKIIILPAWWQSWWFYLLLVVSISGIIFYAIWDMLKRQIIKSNFEFEKESLRKQLELDDQQLQFFTNLSHEIKTPLSLILSPLEEVLKNKKFDAVTHRNLALVQKNAMRIKRLTKNAIDYRRTQFKTVQIEAERLDIVRFLKVICDDFGEFAGLENITVKLNSKFEKLFVWFDVNMLESIFYNLLSNAVKYSEAGQGIQLNIDQRNNQVVLEVRDFGKGIPEDELEHVFERFYQSKNHIGGSGIGLELVKKLVEAHKGSIKVKSELKVGSCFEITLNLGEDHLLKEEKKVVSYGQIRKTPEYRSEVVSEGEVEPIITPLSKSLLIVEDEIDLREYLKVNLSQLYDVQVARNGVEALSYLKNDRVDLVISDVMMPEMDGYELCETIKGDSRLNAIPVILLTAKNLTQNRIKGYNKGADAYIDKPFQLEVLKSRINNLLRSREFLNNKFLDFLGIDIAEKTLDQEFYERCIQILETHLSNQEFDVTFFCTEIGMSKSQIYKRLNKITDIGVNEMMLKLRMNRASQLLLYTSKSILEIATEVGFNNSKYFSTYFKKQFSMTPSVYRKNNRNRTKRIETD